MPVSRRLWLLENRLRWSAQALREVEALLAHTATNWPEAADKIGAAILAATETVQAFPYIGRIGIRRGTRERVLRRYPYILVYTVDLHPEGRELPAVVNIVSLRHARMGRPARTQR